jgi:hypothetical protein
MITLNQELLSIVELINSKLMGEDLLLFVMALERAGVFETVNVDGKTQWGMAPGKTPADVWDVCASTFVRSRKSWASIGQGRGPATDQGRGFPIASRSGRAVDHV